MKVHKWQEIRDKMGPERCARLDTEVQKMLAEALHIQQPAVAKLEKRTDMYISTLRSHIRAMGGELEITARFPDGAVRITNFANIGD